MVHEWAKESLVTDAADEAEIDICLAVDIYISMKEVDLYNKVAAGPNNSWWYTAKTKSLK